MKKLLTYFSVLFLFVFTSSSFAQLATDSWGFGFGFTYPRTMNANYDRSEANFGGHLSIQRNFSEHVGLRLKANYLNLKGDVGAVEVKTSHITGLFDLMYYFVPCEPVSPYLTMGAGFGYIMMDPIAGVTSTTADGDLDYQIQFGVGAEWRIGQDWRLKTELQYNQYSNPYFEGVNGVSVGSALGAAEDAYMTFDLGLVYYFGKGEASKYCQIYDGLKLDEMPDPVDYERIENLVKKYIPREVVKEVVVEKPVAAAQQDWVLVGVNFDFGSARLKQESYPVLFHATQVLLQNPSMKVEVAGYTDNIGSEKANQALSEKRAKAVYDYLVARGVARDRLTYKGYGESNPIGDNKTADGRYMNRRIEFKNK